MLRKFPRPIKRVVIKVGSSVIATYRMKPEKARLRSLTEQISRAAKNGVEVVLVSSGAIVLGMGELNLRARPSDLASLQALAAIGQTVLMRTYSELFKKSKLKCAQILLTWDDFNDRTRYNNARHTFQALLSQGVVPVINENDTIATDEIKFGDNDKLSSLVSSLINADLLLILSDVEGLYDTSNGDKRVFEEIKEITQEIEGIASGTSKKNISRGGMTAKLQAIKMATYANIPCVIANGETENVLSRVLSGEKIGTLFVEKEEKGLARKHWISFGAKPKGSITVDDGAKSALVKGGKSLLLPGIVAWDGHFKSDDIVVVYDKEKQEIGRGIINYSVGDLHKIDDKKGKREVIHCDNLVLSER
jgi:glutamate 5-kinase